MSFDLLKEYVIDVGLCTYCGICARNCKHINEVISPKKAEKANGTPRLPSVKKRKCIMTKHGLSCGLCFESCPVIKKKKILTTRQQILTYVNEHPKSTVPEICEGLTMKNTEVRYDVLRLVQEKQIKMEIGVESPLFYPKTK